MKRLLIKTIVILLVAGLSATGFVWYLLHHDPHTVSFRMASIKRGDLVATISATGTVEPEEVIDVGAQVAGQIESFGTDKNGKPINYGSTVEAGTVLAQIDDSLYAADVASANAGLAQGKANLERSEADLGELKAKLDQAERDWNRAQKLGPSEALAQSSYDAYKAAYETARANLAVGEATVVQNKAAVLQAEAVLQRAKRNLGYCTIISPVKGVIVDRRVNIGQTVVSSLNAPSLFLLAKDLTRMQVWVSVNEADIGNIHPNQPVTFTVDARPGETFVGKVGRVRLNATMTQNVVTYTVEVITDNSSGKLLPYLTANGKFEIARHNDVLMAPNAALRWSPQPQQIAPEFREAAASGEKHRGGRSGPGFSATETGQTETRLGTLWVKDEGDYLRPYRVQTGLSDGSMTEVQSDKLKEGLEVVVAEGQQEMPHPEASTNPFTPQLSRGRQGSQGQQRPR